MKNVWKSVPLGDVCEFIDRRGVTPEKLGSKFRDSGFRVISAKNIKGRGVDTTAGEQRFVDSATYGRWMQSPLSPDDVLLTSEAPLGEPAYITEQLAWCLGQRLFGIRTDKQRLCGRYLYFAFQGGDVREDMLSRATGATAQGIRQSELRKVAISLPPVPEQQRIVGILDEAFAGMATAKANAEKNLRNARDLYDHRLRSCFASGGAGWSQTTIGDQMMFQRGFDITKDKQKAGAVPVVSSGGVKSFHNEAMAKAPGVVIGRKGTLGKVFYLDCDYWPHDTTLWVKDFKGNNARFVYHFLLSLDVAHLDSGSANPALNRNVLHPIPTEWPQVRMQASLASHFDSLHEEGEHLASLYHQKLAALDALKKSLLHQAFSGALTSKRREAFAEAVV